MREAVQVRGVSVNRTSSVFQRIYNALFPPEPDYAYDKIEEQQRAFYKYAVVTENQYYADAASGLAIALQVIDRERYDRLCGGEATDGKDLREPCLCPCHTIPRDSEAQR